MCLISAERSVHLCGPATEKTLTSNLCPGARDVVFVRHCGTRDVVFVRHCGTRDVVFVRLKICSTFLSHVFVNDVVMFCSVLSVIDKLLLWTKPYLVLW